MESLKNSEAQKLPRGMFFIKNCTQIFMTDILQIVLISDNKNTEYVTPTQWLCKCFKFYEDYIEFDTEQAENTKREERQKASFPKGSVENADFYTPVLNK